MRDFNEKTYNELIYDVHKISVEAATFLQNKARDIRPFMWDTRSANKLASAFVWEMTPQGHDFWEDIEEKLNFKIYR